MKQGYLSLASDTFVFAAGNMLIKLIQFFLLPMYTALLTAEQYGVGELVNNMSELLYPVCCLGIYEGVFRYAVDHDSDKRAVFSTGAAVSLALAPVVAAVGVVGYSITGFDYTWYLVSLCLATSFRAVCMQFAKGIGMTKLYAASGVASTLALCALSYLLLGVFGAGVSGYLAALLISQLVQLVIVACGARVWRYFSLRDVDGRLMRKLLCYSLPMIPNALAWWFVNLSGRYIVLFAEGAAVAGLYTAASKLPAVMNMIVTIFQQAWQIFSAREYSSEDRSESFETVLRVFSSVLLCTGSLVIALTNPLAQIMLSGEFYEARLFVPFLMLGAIVNGYSTYFGTLYNAAKRNGMIFVTTVAGALVNIAVGVLLSGFVGVWGPIFGAVVAYVLISFLRLIDTRKIVQIRIDVTYQVTGLSVLFFEVIILSFDAPLATVIAMGASVALIVFTVMRYREMWKQIGGLLKGGRW